MTKVINLVIKLVGDLLAEGQDTDCTDWVQGLVLLVS